MTRITRLIRDILSWLGRRLSVRPNTSKSPTSMARNRERAIAAWKHLVSEHAPHLLHESSQSQGHEPPLHWPRMLDPAPTGRQRAWPGMTETERMPPVMPRQRATPPMPEDAAREPRRRAMDNQQPNPAYRKANHHPQASDNARQSAGQTRPDTAHPTDTPVQGKRPRAPIASPESTGHCFKRWLRAISTPSASRKVRTTDRTTMPGHQSGESPGADCPSPERRGWPPTETGDREPSVPVTGYRPPMPEPGNSANRGTGNGPTGPETRVFQEASARLETPMPASPARDSDPWAPLPTTPWPEPAASPRPAWSAIERRRRLAHEQRGVL